jgi:hypothetical protein
MSHLKAAAAVTLLGVALSVGLVASSDVISANAAASEPVQLNAVLDQQIVQLEMTPSVGQPAVAESQAIKLAESAVPSSTGSTGIQSQYVRLTIRGGDGQVIRGIDARPAWLITFKGVGYTPPGTSGSVCSCSMVYGRPNTLAALDAQTGAIIARMGVSD